jgi:hypothetical protein
MRREPREIHLSASPPGKWETSDRASRTGFSPERPQALPDLNKTLLKAIFMVNEIVTRLVRNNWYYGGKSIAE